MELLMSNSPRIIIHADMDAFYASVEMLDDPDLRAVPLAVGGSGQRAVVAAANYSAREFGIKSAMPMPEARRRCRQLKVVPPRFSRYKAVSAQIMSVFRDFTPIIEPLSLDEAFLDVSDYVLQQDVHDLARTIKSQVYEITGGLSVSIGAAPNKLVAKIASDIDKPNGLVVVQPDAVLDFLAPLPVSRLWGAGPKTVAKLEQLGCQKIADIREAPAGHLLALGSIGRLFQQFAFGIDDRSVSTVRIRKSLGSEMTLPEDTWMNEGCLPWLESTARQISAELVRKKLACSGVRFKLKYPSHQIQTRQMKLHAPTQDWRRILAAGRALVTPFFGKTKVRLVGLSVYALSEPTRQMSLKL